MTGPDICGTCYQLVIDPPEGPCPKCGGPLKPSPEEKLQAFADNGSDPIKRGVTVAQAREAASSVLGALLHETIKLRRHHLGETCSDCEED